MKNNGLNSWIKENSWNIIIMIAGFIAAWALLNARVSAMEAKVSQYPSQDFFTLKFQNIDEKLDNLNKKIEGLDN